MERPGLDARRLGALAHPLRLQILEAAESEAVSPSDLAVALRQPLGVVAYHFRVLHNVGLIDLVATEPRRGSVSWASGIRYAPGPWSPALKSLAAMPGSCRLVPTRVARVAYPSPQEMPAGSTSQRLSALRVVRSVPEQRSV
jgi:hypothetical protein